MRSGNGGIGIAVLVIGSTKAGSTDGASVLAETQRLQISDAVAQVSFGCGMRDGSPLPQ
jgi:hypothetical protein